VKKKTSKKLTSLLQSLDVDSDPQAQIDFLIWIRVTYFLYYTCRTLIGVGLGQERGTEQGERGGYEKDIRDIVEYFERSCHVRDKLHRYHLLQAVLWIRIR
jgi:hypothetical protein